MPDGVGGALKRKANDLVLHGKDIMSAESFVENCKDSSVFAYEVGQKAIDYKTLILSNEKLKPVPGTLKLHQIRYSRYGEILHRDASCTCSEGSFHTGHHMKQHSLINRREEKNSDKPKEQPQDETETNKEGSKNTKTEESKFPTPDCHETPILVTEGDSETRKSLFSKMLEELGQCQTFDGIKEKCADVLQIISEKGYEMDYEYSPCIMNTGIAVDECTLSLCPTDIPQDTILYPVTITADGNCLPYSGSVIASGKEDMGDEMRVRIIIESSVYKDAYLNQTFLERGAEETNDSLAKTYAFYSDEYSNEALSDGQIERIYENEIVKITRNKSYMGIWHIFALSSVLCRNIFSVYPKLGNQNVRKDLHRLIKPREVICSETSYIMWTTTRKDMTRKNWIPNHFVTLLPIDQPTKKDENEKAVKDNDAKLEEVVEAKGITLETEKTSKERNMDAEKNDQESVKQEGNVNKDTEEIDTSATKEQTDNSEKGHKSTRNHLDISDLSPQDLLGQYVLVSYDNKPYPGIVTD